MVTDSERKAFFATLNGGSCKSLHCLAHELLVPHPTSLSSEAHEMLMLNRLRAQLAINVLHNFRQTLSGRESPKLEAFCITHMRDRALR